MERVKRIRICDGVFNGDLGGYLAVVVVKLKHGQNLADRWHCVQTVNLLKTNRAPFDEHEFPVKVSNLQTIDLAANLHMLPDSHLNCLRREVIINLNFLLLWGQLGNFWGRVFGCLDRFFVFLLDLLEVFKLFGWSCVSRLRLCGDNFFRLGFGGFLLFLLGYSFGCFGLFGLVTEFRFTVRV